MSLNAPLATSGDGWLPRARCGDLERRGRLRSRRDVAAHGRGIPLRAWFAWRPATAVECSPRLGSELGIDKCELRRDRLQLCGVRGRRRPDLKFMIRAS